MEKISQKIALEIAERVITPEVKSIIEATKAASDEASGTFEVVITTENLDRYNEVIKLDGWETENYMLNPVVLWGHDHRQLPIGICTELRKAEGKMIARGKFAMHEFAQEIRRLYDLEIVRATSVGFIEKEREGNLITKAELIEFSFVSVPANPYCLSTLVKSGISVNDLATKGILNINVKDNEEEAPQDADQDADQGDQNDEDADVEQKDDEEADGEAEDADEDGADDAQDDQGEEQGGEDVKSIKEAVKNLKSAILAFEVALKEAPERDEAGEEVGDEADDDGTDKEEDQDSEGDDPNETPDQKAFRLFKLGRKLMQEASTAISESLAEARKHVESRQ